MLGVSVALLLALTGCSRDAIDIDPSTIGGAEPSDTVGRDVSERDDPVLRRGGDDDQVPPERPDALDRLAVEDAGAPWFLADGVEPHRVRAQLAERLGEDAPGVCDYLDGAIPTAARARLMVPGADLVYPADAAIGARRLVTRSVADVLLDEIDTWDARLAAALVDRCELDVEVARLRDAARASLRARFDRPSAELIDPADDGWTDRLPVSLGGRAEGGDEGGAEGRAEGGAGGGADGSADAAADAPVSVEGAWSVASLTGSDARRSPAVVAAWRDRLADLEDGECDWFTAPPRAQAFDDVVERLVVLRRDAHDGLPAAAEAVAERCLDTSGLDWRPATDDLGGPDDGGAENGEPAGSGAGSGEAHDGAGNPGEADPSES